MSQIDLTAIREKLSAARGKQYWRSLEEAAETPEFRKFVEDEFPDRAKDWNNVQSRRDVLRLMAGMFAMAGVTGCVRQPQERILPYVRQPEEIIPGRPLFFATSMPFRGSAIGLLVESHEGRPVKIEGNPLHPASLGRTLPFNQTSTLDLYDPDRSQTVMFRGRISGWGQFLGAMADLRSSIGTGAGLHFLSDVVHSPTLLAQRAALQKRFPAMGWHEYDPVGQDNAAAGARLAFGAPVNTIYRFDKADVIVSLDADFLFSVPGSIPYARQFISRRHAESDRRTMNRLYAIEPSPTITGDKADHRIPVKAAEVELFARALAAQIGIGGITSEQRVWTAAVAALARDLQAHRGASVVVPGEQQPPVVHALAHTINHALGNVGNTVVHTELPVEEPVDQSVSVRALVDDMRAGNVRALVILSSNPAYDLPADLQFVRALQNVPLRVHFGTHFNETGELCHWHLPEAHYLESWSDATAFDGTVSIIQPLIEPLYGGKTAHEVLATLTESPDQTSYDIVRGFWQTQVSGTGFEEFWERALHDGLIPNTAFALRNVSLRTDVLPAAPAEQQAGLEIVFRPDPTVWDGRFANNGWLQECPKPHTKLTWDNPVAVSPATAQRLGLASEDVVELRYRGRTVEGPVWITPGQANDSVTVYLGYGRTRAGRLGTGTGYSAYAVRTSDAPHFGSGLELRKTGRRYQLACTQDHNSMEGRDIVRSAANQEFLANPKLFATPHEEGAQVTLSLYPEWNYQGYRWGMAIDHNACIGCNACVVACQTENNVAVVGKDQVLNGREMHWLRIDRYFSGNIDNPETHFQPMLCQHCEKAPCEPVCPVAATVHSAEGLSQMIYNRCIGTRYCSNNCPYKVRRFNFLLYSDWNTPSLEPLRNPDVSVRSRGVMEKCSFCIQRIQEAKIEAEKEGRRIRDGEVVTACQGACPTDAIIFGDLNDKGSLVSKLQQNVLGYSVLAELGTQPRISYMAELRNPNPELITKS